MDTDSTHSASKSGEDIYKTVSNIVQHWTVGLFMMVGDDHNRSIPKHIGCGTLITYMV